MKVFKTVALPNSIGLPRTFVVHDEQSEIDVLVRDIKTFVTTLVLVEDLNHGVLRHGCNTLTAKNVSQKLNISR